MRRGEAGASMNIKSTTLQLKSTFQTPRSCIRSFGGPERPESIKTWPSEGRGKGSDHIAWLPCASRDDVAFAMLPRRSALSHHNWETGDVGRKRGNSFFFPSSLFSCLGSFLLFLCMFFFFFASPYVEATIPVLSRFELASGFGFGLITMSRNVLVLPLGGCNRELASWNLLLHTVQLLNRCICICASVSVWVRSRAPSRLMPLRRDHSIL